MQFVEVFSGLCANPDTGHYLDTPFIRIVRKCERWCSPSSSPRRSWGHTSFQKPLPPSFLCPAGGSDGCPVPSPGRHPESLARAPVTARVSSDKPQPTAPLIAEIQLTMRHTHRRSDQCSRHCNILISCRREYFYVFRNN